MCTEHHSCVHFERALLHYFLGIFVFFHVCCAKYPPPKLLVILPFLGLLGVFLFILSNGYYVISFRLYDNDCIDDYHDDDDDDDEDEDDDAEDDDEDDDDG